MSPVFLITYTTPRTGNDITHETEWICDGSYNEARAVQSFRKQFPTTSVVRIQETDCSPAS